MSTSAAVAAAGGCTKDPKKPPLISEQTPDDRSDPAIRALKAILARRVQAVKAADEATFLADLDPSNPTLLAHQKMVFGNFRQLKFGVFDYLMPPGMPDLGITVSAAPVRQLPVVGITQLTIDDAGTGVLPGEAFQYTLSRRGDRYVVTDIVGLTADNQKSLNIDAPLADTPWNMTPLKVVMVGNVWLAADASAHDLDAYAAVAQEESQRIDRLWGSRLRYPGSLLFLTRDEAAFKAWYGFGAAINYRDTVEGIAPARLGVRTNGQPYRDQYVGARAVVNLRRVDASSDTPRLVLRHELAHAITARVREVPTGLGDTGSPRWAVEGFAAWTETFDNPNRAAAFRQVAKTSFTGTLPRSADFYGGNAAGNYALAATAFLYAQQLKGVDSAVEFYAAVAGLSELDDQPVTSRPAFHDICQRILGTSGSGFLTGWGNYVRNGG